MCNSKYAEFNASGEPLEIREVKIPELKQGEILVRNEQLKINDRITWAIYASDPNSELAKKDIPQKAAGLFKYGHEIITDKNNLHGGLSEFTILRANTHVSKVSENVPLKLTSIINCAVATAAGSLRLAGSVKNKYVLISGAGMLGVVACEMCKVQGTDIIVTFDMNNERLEIAKLFGSDLGITSLGNAQKEIENELNQSRPFHLAIDFSGDAEVMEETLQYFAIGGIGVWVGATHPQLNVQINAEKVIRNLWTIKGLHNYNESDFVNAVSFLENYYKNYPFESLVHDKFNLEQVNEAFEYALKENPFRAGIRI